MLSVPVKNNYVRYRFAVIIFMLLLLFLSNATSASAAVIRVQGNVSGHWTADTVYVDADILVPKGSSLEIDPGTVIVFQGMYGLTIEGNVEAKGTPDHIIHFTGSDTALFGKPEKFIGGWKGILAKSEETPSVFSYVRFTYMDENMPIRLDTYKAIFNHCSFDHNQAIYLLGISRSSNVVKNCVFSQNWVGTSVIYIEGFYQDTIEFNNNTIAYNQGRALFHNGYIESVLNIKNCIFWNYPNTEEDRDKEIIYYPYYEVEYHKSTIKLDNCIVQNGQQYAYYSKSCFNQKPLFVDAVHLNFTPSWKSYPLNNQYKSIAIDNGNYLDDRDPDSSRSDIGAIAYFNAQRQKLPQPKFTFEEVPGKLFNEFQFVNQSINTDNAHFKWDFGDGQISDAQNPAHTYAQNGLYTVKLTLEDKTGYKDSMIVYDAIKVFVGQRILPGAVEGVWKKALSPYYVFGDLTVAAGKKLEIEPGVRVKFMGQYALDIWGSLVSVGTAQDTISFSAYDTTGMTLHKDMNIDYPAGDFQAGKGWGGIHMLSSPDKNDSCLMRYCKISDVRTGENNIQLYQGTLKLYYLKKADIEHCYFLNNLTVPITTTNNLEFWPRIFHTAGIHALGTSAVIKENKFENTYQLGPAAIYLKDADSALISGNVFYNLSGSAVGLDQVRHYSIDHNTFDSVSNFALDIADAIPAHNTQTLNHVVYNTFANGGLAMYGDKGTRNVLIAYNTIHNNLSVNCAGLRVSGDSIYVVNNLFYENANTLQTSSFIGVCVNMGLDLNAGKYGIIANNTFVDNLGSPYQSIVAGAREVKIYNNILQDLDGKELQATIFVEYQDRFVPFDSVYNNDVIGNYPPENGNIDVDPVFIDRDNRNYALAVTSPLINQGYPEISDLYTTDKDYYGNPRLDKYLRQVDIGAAEFQPEPLGSSILSNDTVMIKLLPGAQIGTFSPEKEKSGYITAYELIHSDENNIHTDNKDFILTDNKLSTATIFTEAGVTKKIAVRVSNNFGATRDTVFNIYIKDNPAPARPYGIQLSNNEIQAGSPGHTAIGRLTTLDSLNQMGHEYSFPDNEANSNNKDIHGNPIFVIEDDFLYAAVSLPDTPSIRTATIRTMNEIGEYYDSSIQIKVIPVEKDDDTPEITTVFPNPFISQICISPDSKNQQGLWKIYALNGQALLSGKFEGKTYVNLMRLSSGIYFLKIIAGNRQMQFKIIKK